MADRFALFRHAFHREARPADVPMVEAVARAQRNPKKAVKNWRVVVDKILVLEALVGLEESVHSWLPADTAGTQLSTPSSKQLAEHIAHADQLAPIKSKSNPAKNLETCRHEEDKLVMGANQYSSWVSCRDCHARWAAPRSWTTIKKKPGKEALTTGAGSSTDVIREELKKEYQASLNVEKDNHVRFMRAYHAEQQKTSALEYNMDRETKQLRSELREASKMVQLTSIMSSCFAEMAMGKSYVEHKGYHDSEIVHAEEKLKQEQELEELHRMTQRITSEHETMVNAELMRGAGSVPAAMKKVQNKMEKDRSTSPVSRRRHG